MERDFLLYIWPKMVESVLLGILKQRAHSDLVCMIQLSYAALTDLKQAKAEGLCTQQMSRDSPRRT